MNELEKKTVLILDDEMLVRQRFFDYFEDRLRLPIASQSSEEALNPLDRASPHCALVDIRLGGMDDHTFMRKANRKNPQMAVANCTGSPEYVIPTDIYRLPSVSDRVFTKPVTDMADLEAELMRLITRIENGGVRNDVI